MFSWDALKENARKAKILLTITEPCLNPEILQEQLKKLPCSENLRISSWSYDMEGHAKKCVGRYCELPNTTTQQLYKVSTPCIDDHHFKVEEMKSDGDLLKVLSQIVLTCLHLARIGRPYILWTVNKLARSMTFWTKACDKRSSRLISYFHCACEYKQYCHVVNNAKQCTLGLFQDSDVAGNLWGFKIYFGWNTVHFWKPYILFRWVGCVRNKLQFRTVQQNQKSFPWTQDWGWTVHPRLNYGVWSSKFFTETRIRVIKNGETRART